VDHDVAKVYQHPFAAVLAFDREHFTARLAYLFVDIAGQRLDLPVRIAGGNHHVIEHRGELGGVDDFDFLALDVFKGGNDDFLQLANVH